MPSVLELVLLCFLSFHQLPAPSSQPLSFHFILSSSNEKVLYKQLLHADPET